MAALNRGRIFGSPKHVHAMLNGTQATYLPLWAVPADWRPWLFAQGLRTMVAIQGSCSKLFTGAEDLQPTIKQACDAAPIKIFAVHEGWFEHRIKTELPAM
jgi:hypothetical protein